MHARVRCSALRIPLLLGGARGRRMLPFGREPLHLYQTRPHVCKALVFSPKSMLTSADCFPRVLAPPYVVSRWLLHM